MGRRTVTQLANQIKRVLSPTAINDLGRDVGFCVRERLITPYRLVLSAQSTESDHPFHCERDHRFHGK